MGYGGELIMLKSHWNKGQPHITQSAALLALVLSVVRTRVDSHIRVRPLYGMTSTFYIFAHSEAVGSGTGQT
jgi:hypothetical protein